MSNESNRPTEEASRANPFSRREFARRAALATTTAALMPAVLAQEAPAPKPAASPDKPPQPQTGLSPELQEEGELKFQWIIHRYGDRLSAVEKEDVHRLVMESQKPLGALRSFPVDNGDMPALVLKFTNAETGDEGRRP